MCECAGVPSVSITLNFSTRDSSSLLLHCTCRRKYHNIDQKVEFPNNIAKIPTHIYFLIFVGFKVS
jgi:hypothetical protein